MDKGTVKFFNEEKGFGFIAPERGENDLFVHVTGIEKGPIKEGNQVTFDVTQSKKGLCAVNVKIQ